MKNAVALVLIALAGCGGGGSVGGVIDPLENVPRCASWDQKIVSAKTWGDGCKLKPTELVASGQRDCKDGRLLFWNDWGWGYGGEVAHHHARADGQLVPPDDVDEACRG